MALAKYDDLSGTGLLIEQLEIPETAVRTSVMASLARMLPRLRASDASRIDPHQRQILRNRLSANPPRKDPEPFIDFVIASLKGLEQIGDATFLPTVEAISEGRYSGSDERARTAAVECLPFLRSLVENEKMRHDLLRASASTPANSSDILLRAADSTSPTSPDELLRPTESNLG